MFELSMPLKKEGDQVHVHYYYYYPEGIRTLIYNL